MLLTLARLPRSTFFARRKIKEDKDAELKQKILEIKKKNPNYGYRRVNAKLKGINHKRIQRLMAEMGLQVRSKNAENTALTKVMWG